MDVTGQGQQPSFAETGFADFPGPRGQTDGRPRAPGPATLMPWQVLAADAVTPWLPRPFIYSNFRAMWTTGVSPACRLGSSIL